jgi:hypothetical protein
MSASWWVQTAASLSLEEEAAVKVEEAAVVWVGVEERAVERPEAIVVVVVEEKGGGVEGKVEEKEVRVRVMEK